MPIVNVRGNQDFWRPLGELLTAFGWLVCDGDFLHSRYNNMHKTTDSVSIRRNSPIRMHEMAVTSRTVGSISTRLACAQGSGRINSRLFAAAIELALQEGNVFFVVEATVNGQNLRKRSHLKFRCITYVTSCLVHYKVGSRPSRSDWLAKTSYISRRRPEYSSRS